MEIIRASARDIEEILSLCQDCSENMTQHSIDQWDEIYPNKQDFLADVETGSLYLAVSNSKKITGCIVLNEYQEPEYREVAWEYQRERIAVIHRLMVHPNYEGQGIAQSLVRYVERLAKERGYEAVRLDVFTENPRAINFYHKLGYKVAGKIRFRKGEFWCCEKLLLT